MRRTAVRILQVSALVWVVFAAVWPATAQAVPSAITYQGRLTNTSGAPVPDGSYQVQFKLYTVETGGSPSWTSSAINVNTSGEVFTARIEGIPAGAFSSADTWLETVVEAQTLTPRTKLASVPYAFRSGDSWSLSGNSGTSPGTQFLGTSDNNALEMKVNNERAFRLEPNAVSPNLIGGYSANSVTPGAGGATISGGGDSTNANVVTDSYGAIGGGRRNQAGDNAGDASDRPYTTVAGGYNNVASGFAAVVGGGEANKAEGWTSGALGGELNTASGNYSVVAGGQRGTASGHYSVTGGGGNNSATGYASTVTGGNYSTAGGDWSTVGGGGSNAASGYGGTVGGGAYNAASGLFSTVPGGVYTTASGDYSFAAGRFAQASHTGSFVWADSTYAYFPSTADNQFLIRASGGVGIGTNSPTNVLTVAGGADISGNLNVGTTADVSGPLYVGTTANVSGALNVGADTNIDGTLRVGAMVPWYARRLDVVGGDNWDLTNTEGDFRIGNDAFRLKMGVALGGGGAGAAGIRAVGGINLLALGTGSTETVFIRNDRLGVGTADPAEKLHVSGNVKADNYLYNSDLRLKKNIAPLAGALESVSRLSPVTFDWQEGEGHQIGFIAQEIKDVLPEIAHQGDDGLYGVDYAKLTPLLVAAIKEQQKTIEDQQKAIDGIKAELAALKAQQGR